MHVDILIVGAGISGASAAFELAAHRKILLLEAEPMPGYHSTGRSAALYTRNYGNPLVRLINQASYGFFAQPPEGFSEHPLLTPRGQLAVASAGHRAGLEAILAMSETGHDIHEISAARCLELAPLLRPEMVSSGAYEPGVMDMDVAAIHQGFLRGFKARGGVLACNRRIERIERRDGLWHVSAADFEASAPIVINAAGAWADDIGALAGAGSIGLVPKRRTAITVDVPAGVDIAAMPAIDFVGSDSYIKPEAGRLMASPGDETPSAPQDAQPEELDIAILADWLENQTILQVRRIASSWAGLRSFVADGSPVVGFDALAPGFFWLAGQGGCGIMMAPSLARATAALILRGEFPADLISVGIRSEALAPGRVSALAGSVQAPVAIPRV